MQLIRFAIGMSLVAVSVLGSARANRRRSYPRSAVKKLSPTVLSRRFRKWISGSVIASSLGSIFVLACLTMR